ncbi:LA_1737 family protein [Leptospira gomenensis]
MRETSSFHGILFPLYHSRADNYDKNGVSANSGYSLFFPFYYTNFEDRWSGGTASFRRKNIYTPLFLYRNTEDASLRVKKVVWISPLFYSSTQETMEGNSIVSESDLFLPIPLLYKYDRVVETPNSTSPESKNVREISGWNWIFLANYERSRSSLSLENRMNVKLLLGGIFGFDHETSSQRESYSWNASLFYFRKRIFEAGVLKYSSDVIPILYSNEETENSSETTILLLAGTKSDRSSGMKRVMFLPFWYEKEETSKRGYTDSKIFTPLFFQSKSQQESADGNYSVDRFYPILPLPLLYTFESRIREDKLKKDVYGFDWLVFANYKKTGYPGEGNESVSLKAAFALFGYEKEVTSKEYESSWYLFPFVFYKNSNRNGVDSYRTVIPVLAYRSYREFEGKVQSRTNLLGIFLDYQRNDYDGSFSFFLFPSLYFSKEDATGDKTSAFLPLFYYSRNMNNPEYSFFLMGLYRGRSSEYVRSNFLYLFDIKNSIREQKTELSLFLGVFHSEFEKDRTRWAVLGGVLAGYESSPVMTDWNFLWIRYLNSPQERIQNFLPIYRYSETADSSSLLAPPILTYHSADKDGSLTLAGLGLLYYKNRSRIDREENTKILGGLAFFSESKAERGYRSMGSLGLPLLGGLLWQYEFEDETGFEKFSLLKFVYSRTTHNGKTYNRIFGIKL